MKRADKSPEGDTTNLLSGKVAVIVTHVRGLGPSNHLETYLNRGCQTVLAIDHPLVYERPATSRYRLFENGKLVATGEHLLRGPEIGAFFQEFILAVYWTRRLAHRSDLFIGVDALNCVSGIVSKLFNHKSRVIFYVIDWSPKRFDNKILNGLYHLTDRLAALCADETWNQSEAIDQGRWYGPFWTQVGKRAQRRVKIVPNAVASMDLDIDAKDRLPYRLVFLGHLLEKQGLQLVIKALPQIASSFDDVDLVVIGSGPYQPTLEELSTAVGVGDRVQFLGYVEDEAEVLKILASASCGLAPYLASEQSFTKFADPGKLKNYLATGLPIVMTRVPFNAAQLENSDCAIVVEDSSGRIADGVCILLAEDVERRRYRREKAFEFMKGLDWDSVFAKALSNTFDDEDRT